MIALIDADVLVYRIGFTTEADPEWVAAARIDESIGLILRNLETTQYHTYITGADKSNFRYTIYPDYKANRKAPKPRHYEYIREYLQTAHNASVCHGEEADDRLGIHSTTIAPEGCIASIDKDLDQIPGWHYNWVKNIKYKVTPEEGLKFFYRQLLTGDKAVDNIPGLRGIGPKKADAALASYTSELQLFNKVQEMYRAHYPDSWARVMLRNGQLLKIRTKENEIWEFPQSGTSGEPDQGNPLQI